MFTFFKFGTSFCIFDKLEMMHVQNVDIADVKRPLSYHLYGIDA